MQDRPCFEVLSSDLSSLVSSVSYDAGAHIIINYILRALLKMEIPLAVAQKMAKDHRDTPNRLKKYDHWHLVDLATELLAKLERVKENACVVTSA